MKSVKIAVIIITLIFLFPLEANEGLSGTVYYKWVYQADDEQFNAFSYDRLYVAYEKQLREGIQLKLLTDIKNTAGIWAVRQKNAYLQYQTTAGDLLIGMQAMNLFNVIKDNWGYRFLAKSSMNEWRWASSADMGVGYKVTLAGKTHLHFTVTNGPGFDRVENDRFKKFAAQVVYGTKKLGLKPGFNVGLVGTRERYEAADITEAKSVLALFGALTVKSVIRLGGEFDREMDSGEDVTKQVIAAYFDLRVRSVPKLNLNLFGRVESYDPDLGTGKDGELNLMIGVNIFPIAAINIAPNLRYSIPQTGESGVKALQLNFEFKY